MHRHSLIHKVFWRTVEAAVLLLVGAFLGVGSATAEVDTTITAVNDTAADPGETVIVSASARRRAAKPSARPRP